MNITAHFSFEELTHTNLKKYQDENRRKAAAYIDNLRLLATDLEELRAAIGEKPIVASSGFRFDELNREVGGAHRSGHLFGLAADIVAEGMSVEELFQHIKESPTKNLAKCILETRPSGAKWVHLSVSPSPATPIFLVCRDGKKYERA